MLVTFGFKTKPDVKRVDLPQKLGYAPVTKYMEEKLEVLKGSYWSARKPIRAHLDPSCPQSPHSPRWKAL